MLLIKSIFALTILLACAFADDIDFYDIIEPCEGLFVTKDHEQDWEEGADINERTTLYFPFVSKLYAFRLTQNLYKSPQFKKLTESQLVNSCITVRHSASGKTPTTYGYNKKKFKKQLREIAPKVTYFPRTFPHGIGAQTSIALTDNKSYTLLNVCYEDGTRSFAVISKEPTLDDDTLKTIKAHLKSTGFNEENFLTLNYNSCVQGNDGIMAPSVGVDELPKPMKPRPGGWVLPFPVTGSIFPSYPPYYKK